MAVVPSDERARANDTGKFLACNVETAIARGAGCQHDYIVERHQLLKLNIAANFDIAEKAYAVAGQHTVEHTRHCLRALMIRRNSIPAKSEGHRQPVEDVDGSIGNQAKQVVCQVTTRRTATDDGYLFH